MSRRTRAIYDDPRDMFDFGCRFRGAYDIGNGKVPSITSSGTSASSLAPQMQRYPQTTSAYRQPMNEFQTPLRGYVVTEPCLSAPPTGPTAGQLSAAYYSSPAGRGRTSRNFAYSERTNSPRTPSPADISRRRKRAEVENIVAKYCGEEEAQSPIDSKPHRGNAPSARRKLQFDCGPPEKSGAPRTPRPPKPPGPPKTPGSPKTPGTPGTRSTCGPANAPKSACSTTPKKVKPVSEMFDPADQAVLFGTCPNLAPEESPHCAFQETDKDSDEGFIAKLMKKFKGPTNPCPLKVDFSNRKSRTYGALLRKKSSCFSKKNDSKDESLEQLDDLWNPDTFMRWKCIDNWDQHKESLWRSVIQAKLDCPESHNRCIEDMMYDAFKAMNAPGGECISFRMIYGILRRNEDVYLNPYIDHFTDEQFLKLIVALNRFFMDDKDKRKMFFDHPPPTFIEKIMMKETLGVLDPSCPSQTIARRFWELLLDWYARKINAPDDAQQDC